MSLYFSFTLIFTILSGIIYADTDPHFVNQTWKGLLHYQKTVIGLKSEVDDPTFFIHPQGPKNPQLEYEANVSKVKELNLDYICKFPARFKYLNQSLDLNIDLSVLKKCDKYQVYILDHEFKNVNLVFSSYYLESPASAFGHTFLRFSKNENLKDDKSSELLDIGINYGAVNTSSNPLIYTVYGIFGGFKGSFSSIPYFYKIREYNDFESRDLWSYELNLTQKQKEKLLDHLWELGNTWFDYYFFTGNCSQKIMSLLDGVEPSWKFLEKLPFYIIPAETIKVLSSVPDFVKKVTFRPSKRRLFNQTYAQLNELEKEIFKELADHDNWQRINDVNISGNVKARVLDVLIEYADYKFAKEILFESGEKYIWKQKILKSRSELSKEGIDLNIEKPKNEEPHISHAPGKIKVAIINNLDNKKNVLGLSHRFALHDFTDQVDGNPRFSSINFFKTDFEISKNKIRLDSLTAVEVASLNPWGNFFYPMSIYGKIDFSKDQYNLCDSCNILKATIASGPSFSFYNERVIPYILFMSEILYSDKYNKNIDVNAGIMSGVVLRIKDFASMHFRYHKGYTVLNKKENYVTSVINQFHHSKKIDTSIESILSTSEKKIIFGLNIFY